MYPLHDREKFALRLVLFTTVPFAILTAIAIIKAVQSALGD